MVLEIAGGQLASRVRRALARPLSEAFARLELAALARKAFLAERARVRPEDEGALRGRRRELEQQLRQLRQGAWQFIDEMKDSLEEHERMLVGGTVS
jgi:hypothetical protein